MYTLPLLQQCKRPVQKLEMEELVMSLMEDVVQPLRDEVIILRQEVQQLNIDKKVGKMALLRFTSPILQLVFNAFQGHFIV